MKNPLVTGALFAIVALGLFWALYFDPQQQALNQEHQQLEAKTRELQQMEAIARQLPQLKAEYEETRRAFDAYLEGITPRAVTHGRAIMAFKELADRLGAEVESVQVVGEPTRLSDQITLHNYEIVLRGSPSAIYDFLASIENARWVLQVKGGAINAERTGVTAAFQTVLPRKEVAYATDTTQP